jgi:hypothetical protein
MPMCRCLRTVTLVFGRFGCLPRGLTPPALGCSKIVCRWKNAFCDAGTNITRSGGRQPAVGEENVLAQKNEFVVRGERQNQERRASARRGLANAIAGTLPENRKDCRQCAHKRRCNLGSKPTGGLRPPLLIGARPLAGEKTPFAMHERTLPGAAGVSPPWFRKPRLQGRPCIAG